MQSCKVNKSIPCESAPIEMTIVSILNMRIMNLRFQNNQQMHITITHSTRVEASNFQVVALQNSPNINGIHIAGSQNVLVEGCSITMGDDYISIILGSGKNKIKEVL